MNLFELETKKLQEIKSKYHEVEEFYNLKLKSIPSTYKDNPFLLARMNYLYDHKIKLMQRVIDKPYFARIDFQEDKHNPEICYIGKVGVSDEDNNIITVDWRAPIASVYYDSNIGEASYYVEGSLVLGKLLIKRQYEIEDGKLINFNDIDTVANDEILKPYLNANADNRLKNIVSTIQKEQNEIIREKIYKNIIVQGVAGSGKTTVALHRIAYLVYNNINTINPEEYMVIGPNKFFVNYISGVLPDLDVDNVSQLTFIELAQDFIQEKFNILSDEQKVISQLSEENTDFNKYRLTIEYKKQLDQYIEEIELDLLPKEDFIVDNFKILSNDHIIEVYKSIEEDFLNYNVISNKIDRTVLLLSKYIEQNKLKIAGEIKNKVLTNGFDFKIVKNIEKKISNGCKTELNKFLKRNLPKVLQTYEKFLNKSNNHQFINNISKKNVEFEDLSALMYIKYRIYGNKEYAKYRHVVVDEAQDYGDFNFYILKEIMSNATFSIFGDLAQSIYQYRSINSWQSVLDNIFYHNCEMKYLAKSYRTTIEIMRQANKITKYLNLGEAIPVIRHGQEVKYLKINQQIEQIITIINQYQAKNYQTIAVITKDELESNYINEELVKHGININNITNSDINYQGGICTLTSYLAKGLEFDAVIISDVTKYNYDKTLEMKLLYVAMTRALHELTVLYNQNLNEILI